MFVFCYSDRTVKVWNLETGTEISTLDKQYSHVTCVRHLPRNNLMFTACRSLITVKHSELHSCSNYGSNYSTCKCLWLSSSVINYWSWMNIAIINIGRFYLLGLYGMMLPYIHTYMRKKFWQLDFNLAILLEYCQTTKLANFKQSSCSYMYMHCTCDQDPPQTYTHHTVHVTQVWDMRHHWPRGISIIHLPPRSGRSSLETAVKDLMVAPNGDLLFSASGNFVNIWDLKSKK